MGNAEKVDGGSLQFHPSGEEYDCGVDDLVNPRWYIVWSTHMNRYILPEYVVSFKSPDHLQGNFLNYYFLFPLAFACWDLMGILFAFIC